MELYVLITDLAILVGLTAVVWLLERQRRERRELSNEANEEARQNIQRLIQTLEVLSADAKETQEHHFQEILGRLETLHKKIGDMIATTESEARSISQVHSKSVQDLEKEVQKVGDRLKSLQESLELESGVKTAAFW